MGLGDPPRGGSSDGADCVVALAGLGGGDCGELESRIRLQCWYRHRSVGRGAHCSDLPESLPGFPNERKRSEGLK